MYLAGISGGMDSEQLQESELFAHADHAVHPSDVGKHSGAYARYGCLVRLLSVAAGRRSAYFRYDIQFHSLYDLSYLQYVAENGQKLHRGGTGFGSQFFPSILESDFPLSMPGVVSGIMMVFMPTISTFAIAELLTMNNIKLFGTTIQENINNSLWNYGAALSLIMLFLIAATSLFAPENKDESEKGGGVW